MTQPCPSLGKSPPAVARKSEPGAAEVSVSCAVASVVSDRRACRQGAATIPSSVVQLLYVCRKGGPGVAGSQSLRLGAVKAGVHTGGLATSATRQPACACRTEIGNPVHFESTRIVHSLFIGLFVLRWGEAWIGWSRGIGLNQQRLEDCRKRETRNDRGVQRRGHQY